MRAVLARHGESVFSVRGALNGDPSIPGPLTEVGEEQARALGVALRDEHFDLCVTSEFERVRSTADIALAANEAVPRLLIPELNDPRYGPFEGQQLEPYREWASSVSSTGRAGEGTDGPVGESRVELVARYARGFRRVLERPEAAILVVGHSLPTAYALLARGGSPPEPRMALVEYTTPYPFSTAELEQVVTVLERWSAHPTW